MLKWRFTGGNSALATVSGERRVDRIVVNSDGCSLQGPGIDVPAGRLTVRLLIGAAGRGIGRLEICSASAASCLAARDVDLAREGAEIALSVDLPEPVAGLEMKLTGDMSLEIMGLEIDLTAIPPEPLREDRPVGYESSKTYAQKIQSGFWQTYFSGDAVLELGYKGYYGTTVPIVPQAIGVDIGYPGYDGVTLPFADKSFDAIYSSHCLEHIPDYAAAFEDWYRLLKVGGYLMIVVPHQHLFEKRVVKPSLANPDHRRFYTADSLLHELATTLPENSYRVRHLRENDEGFDYSLPPRTSSGGSFEIELVVEKIRKPNWNSDDNTVRNYSAGEFFTNNSSRPTAWTIQVDFAQTDDCVIFGPYTMLRPAAYVAEFHFGMVAVDELQNSLLRLDVARDMHAVEAIDLTGPAGLAALRGGIVAVPFTVGSTASYEFRIYRSGAAHAGTARFRGVVLRYA